MTERYDERAATHYAAYRPPLHQIILRRVLTEDERCAVGLDVGCGTGYSAVALARHCEHVIGLEPSWSMLDRSTSHPRVSYVQAPAERMPLIDDAVDIITFAGSLFYAERAATCAEVGRVCGEGTVVVYDFEVLLGEIARRYGYQRQADNSAYDHRLNFSGATGFTELLAGSERVTLDVTSAELAHVLLADSHRFDHFAGRYGRSDPFPALTAELGASGDRRTIQADIFFAAYRTANIRYGRR